MIRRKWIGVLAVFLFLFAVFFLLFRTSPVFRETILYGVGNFLIVSDDLQPADLIHVLGGGDVGRVEYGVELYKQGFGKKMFFTGGRVEPRDMYNLPDSFSSGDYAEMQGVSAEDILLRGGSAANTYEEAVALGKLLDKENSIQAVIVVSTPYHLQRARWVFNKFVGFRVDLQYASVPFAISQYKQRWWEDKLSLAMVKNEYLKLLYYFLKY
jgi:uncharacterized SAM-binding protein YcdF (DUF218 family)